MTGETHGCAELRACPELLDHSHTRKDRAPNKRNRGGYEPLFVGILSATVTLVKKGDTAGHPRPSLVGSTQWEMMSEKF